MSYIHHGRKRQLAGTCCQATSGGSSCCGDTSTRVHCSGCSHTHKVCGDSEQMEWAELMERAQKEAENGLRSGKAVIQNFFRPLK